MTRIVPALLGCCMVLVGCSDQADPTRETEQLTVHELMMDGIAKHAEEIWAVGNAATSDDGGIDPKLMSDEGWSKLTQAAGAMQTDAARLGALQPIVVNRPGVKISDEDTEGGTTSAQVLANIQADTQQFRSMANALEGQGKQLAKAASARDAERAGPLVSGLDQVCESCHLEFWYPEQNEAVAQIEGDAGDVQ